MSAFQVSGTHLAAIVGSCHALDRLARIDLIEAAAVLAAENARSVAHRYRIETEPVEVSEADLAYFTVRPLGPVALLKLIACVEYQCAEPDDWQCTLAMQLLRRLRAIAVYNLPGYRDAAWDLPEGWRP